MRGRRRGGWRERKAMELLRRAQLYGASKMRLLTSIMMGKGKGKLSLGKGGHSYVKKRLQ